MNEKEIIEKFGELLKVTKFEALQIKLMLKWYDFRAILRNVFYVRPVMRRFLRTAEEFEEVVAHKEEHEKPCEKKIVSIKIKFKDGDRLSFSQEYDKDNPVTYIQCYFDFYKWFFMRESEWFSFDHRTGTKIIARENIKQIDFDYSYKSENVV